MKNVTIVVDDDTARWARMEAARRDTSVSRLVGELLRRHMEESEGYEHAMEEFLSRPLRPLSKGGPYPRRDEVHDRAGLR